jgi:hypothetical protein
MFPDKETTMQTRTLGRSGLELRINTTSILRWRGTGEGCCRLTGPNDATNGGATASHYMTTFVFETNAQPVSVPKWEVDCDCMADAQAQAVRMLGDILRNDRNVMPDGASLSIAISDADGHELFNMKISVTINP